MKNFIKNKMITINNEIITNSSYLLRNGDIVSVCYEKKVIPNYNLDILYNKLLKEIYSSFKSRSSRSVGSIMKSESS